MGFPASTFSSSAIATCGFQSLIGLYGFSGSDNDILEFAGKRFNP